jgi:hypothetical protein
MVADYDPNIATASSRLAELAADPDAVRWAQECGWLPGTGHCRDRRCSGDCLFRPQRLAEAARVTSSRRHRRRTQLPWADRRPRPNHVLLAVAAFLACALS